MKIVSLDGSTIFTLHIPLPNRKARLQAEQAWSAISKRPFEVVRIIKRRPRL